MNVPRLLWWRLASTIVTMTIVWYLVHRIDVTLAAGLFEASVILFFHLFVERRHGILRRARQPFVLWLTGLSGSGKSTLANLIYDDLHKRGYAIERLDGDTVRDIFPNTGFTRAERDSHIRRVGFLASMLEKNGVVVIASLISPYRDSREFVRGLCANFIEVHVRASLAECERRDVKGLYRKARAGEIPHFTGIDDPYEEPQSPALAVDTDSQDVSSSLALIMKHIQQYL